MPDYWKEPTKYNPERYCALDPETKLIPSAFKFTFNYELTWTIHKKIIEPRAYTTIPKHRENIKTNDKVQHCLLKKLSAS